MEHEPLEAGSDGVAEADPPGDAISTPCRGVCRAPGGICLGCGRTLTEIAAWAGLEESERLRIMREVLPARCARLGLSR